MVACGGDDGGSDITQVTIDAPEDVTQGVDGDITDVVIDAPADVTQGFCDPLTQTPCTADERCTWIVESRDDPSTTPIEADVGRLGCARAGTIAVGEECVITGPAFPTAEFPSVGMGAGVADNCAKGAWCRQFLDGRGVCKTICDTAGAAGTGPQCGTNFNCARMSATFLSMGTVIAGICEPTCNPVTQKTEATGEEACGSPDPANPYLGCFTGANADGTLGFACSRVPRAAKGRTDRRRAHGPTDSGGVQTGVFSNGCEAGYILGFGPADETVTIANCNGTCYPADSDNSTSELAAAAIGDPTKEGKLHTKAAAAVGDTLCRINNKGSAGPSDCRYGWFAFYVDPETNVVLDSPYQDNVGICYPYSDFTYDHDEDELTGMPPTAEIGVPSCFQLPPYGGNPASTPHNRTADELGCYSWARTRNLPDPTARLKSIQKLNPYRNASFTGGQVAHKHILQ